MQSHELKITEIASNQFQLGLTGIGILMQNVLISFRKLRLFIDISDYKEKMTIGSPNIV